jgi:hypothetical protein
MNIWKQIITNFFPESRFRGRIAGRSFGKKETKYKHYTSYHWVDRVLSIFFSRWNCDSPTPSPAGECAPRRWSGGRCTFTCGRGDGGVPIPTRRHTLWFSRYLFTLWSLSFRFLRINMWLNILVPVAWSGRSTRQRWVFWCSPPRPGSCPRSSI